MILEGLSGQSGLLGAQLLLESVELSAHLVLAILRDHLDGAQTFFCATQARRLAGRSVSARRTHAETGARSGNDRWLGDLVDCLAATSGQRGKLLVCGAGVNGLVDASLVPHSSPENDRLLEHGLQAG